MKAQQAFALVGLAIPDAHETDEDVIVADARIIVQSCESQTSNPNKEFEMLYQTLEAAFSVCKQVCTISSTFKKLTQWKNYDLLNWFKM